MIEELREDALEQNTAQQRFNAIINDIPKSADTIQVLEELYGNLDFSVLREREMGNVKKIVLNPGKITSITGLPVGLEWFECPQNLLTDLENLPITLKHLNVSNNYLFHINISTLKVLEILNISYNGIDVLENIPPGLKELYCNDNQLGKLDFTGVSGLQKLNISNNHITVISNLPSGLVEFKMANVGDVEFRESALDSLRDESFEEKDTKKAAEEEEQKKNYEEALFEYFQLKRDYEAKVLKMKRQAYEGAPTKKMGRLAAASVKPPCIYCKRRVGTIFGRRDKNKYVILCGDAENPCKLNVQIFNGSPTNFLDLLYIFHEEIENIKELIIRQKLDTIFSYVSEEKSVELFKKQMDAYNENSMLFKELMDKYVEYYHDPHKAEMMLKKDEKVFLLIEKVRELLKEYEKTENPEMLKMAMQIQINDIYPEIRNRRMLENEVMELDSRMKGGKEEFRIFKYPVYISKVVDIIGEQPRVVKYVK